MLNASENPLLSKLPRRRERIELAADMTSKVHFSGETVQERLSEFNNLKDIFVPHRTAIELIYRLQSMIYDSLIERDPRSPVNKQRRVSIAKLKDLRIQDLPWLTGNAAGLIGQGSTGCGKSATWKRYMFSLPQTISHSASQECGTLSNTQLVYLHLELSFDGSPKGFLLEGFKALDRALGTEYESKYTKAKHSAEVLLVHFMNLLNIYHCGVLILEEAQKKSVNGSFSELMQNFMLRLMNFGVPVAVFGNPIAMGIIFNHQQLTRRLTVGGDHRFVPAFEAEDPFWERLFSAVWSATIFDEPDQIAVDDKKLSKEIWKITGGVPAYLTTLRREVLDFAASDRNATRVMAAHIRAVIQDNPVIDPIIDITKILVKREYRLLGIKNTDFPCDFMEKEYNKYCARKATGPHLSPTKNTKPAAIVKPVADHASPPIDQAPTRATLDHLPEHTRDLIQKFRQIK